MCVLYLWWVVVSARTLPWDRSWPDWLKFLIKPSFNDYLLSAYWRREWQTASVFLPWEPHEHYEREHAVAIYLIMIKKGTAYNELVQWIFVGSCCGSGIDWYWNIKGASLWSLPSQSFKPRAGQVTRDLQTFGRMAAVQRLTYSGSVL